VPAAGTRIAPVDVGAPRSWNTDVVPLLPVLSTRPRWFHRITRVLRVTGNAASGNAGGSIAAGSAAASVTRLLVRSTKTTRRNSPATCANSATSSRTSIQSSWLIDSTSSRPSESSSSTVAETMLATRLPTLAFSRDHLNVGPPAAELSSWISTR
jgi:hypothetical protein